MRWHFHTLMVLAAVGAAASASANWQPIIFFHEGEFDRLDPEQWRVTVEGEAIVKDQAAVFSTSTVKGYLLLAGHDQFVGSEADAISRSQRRAEAVRELLIRHGVPPDALAVEGCGWSSPYTPTQFGVHAIQNRYVLFWWANSEADLVELGAKVCLPRFGPHLK